MQRSKARIFDEYLASAARAGDAKAMSQLAARWQGRLVAHAARLTGDREIARDAAQDGWVDIIRGVKTLDDAAAFPAWAYRIVTRRAADAIRKAQSTRRVNDAVASEPAKNFDDTAEMESQADAAPLTKAIAQLPADQRAAIALFYTQDLSVAEIAAALDTPAGTVKTRLMHARRKLRAILEGNGSHG